MKIIVFIFALLVSNISHAEFITGNKLYQYMTGSVNVENNIAYGYIAGTFDATYGVLHCPPENVVLRQVVDMVKTLLEKTPELRHNSADQYVIAALKTAWPCKKTATKPEKQV